jgi:hypothetical protein
MLIAAIGAALVGVVTVLALTGGLDRFLPDGWSLPSFGTSSTGATAEPAYMAPVVFPITSDPAGAEVVIDGSATGRTTPLADLELPPGTYHLELRFAALGNWSGEITVMPGSRTAPGTHVALTGTLAAYTSKVTPDVRVFLDDQPIGTAPVSLDSVAAGMHVVRFAGPGGFTWEEETVVRIDESTDVVAPMEGVDNLGLISVRTYRVGPTGKEFARGDRLVVDGREQGTAPAELYLPPGPHQIEIHRSDGARLHRIVRVRAGDHRFVDLRYDRLPALTIEHQAKETVPVDSSPLLTVTLHGQGAGRRHKVHLHLGIDETWKRLTMGPVPGATGTYVIGLPVTSNHVGESVRYYFSVDDVAGQTAYSAIHTVALE